MLFTAFQRSSSGWANELAVLFTLNPNKCGSGIQLCDRGSKWKGGGISGLTKYKWNLSFQNQLNLLFASKEISIIKGLLGFRKSFLILYSIFTIDFTKLPPHFNFDLGVWRFAQEIVKIKKLFTLFRGQIYEIRKIKVRLSFVIKSEK